MKQHKKRDSAPPIFLSSPCIFLPGFGLVRGLGNFGDLCAGVEVRGSRCQKAIPQGLSCFFRQRQWQALLQLIFSRMFALRTSLEDRGGVSLQSSGLVCLLSRVKKIKASPRQSFQVCVQPTIKAWVSLGLAPLLWRALPRGEVSSGPVWPFCGTGTWGTSTGQWRYSSYCYY